MAPHGCAARRDRDRDLSGRRAPGQLVSQRAGGAARSPARNPATICAASARSTGAPGMTGRSRHARRRAAARSGSWSTAASRRTRMASVACRGKRRRASARRSGPAPPALPKPAPEAHGPPAAPTPGLRRHLHPQQREQRAERDRARLRPRQFAPRPARERARQRPVAQVRGEPQGKRQHPALQSGCKGEKVGAGTGQGHGREHARAPQPAGFAAMRAHGAIEGPVAPAREIAHADPSICSVPAQAGTQP